MAFPIRSYAEDKSFSLADDWENIAVLFEGV
jgi:hypothetical protein